MQFLIKMFNNFEEPPDTTVWGVNAKGKTTQNTSEKKKKKPGYETEKSYNFQYFFYIPVHRNLEKQYHN